MSAAALHAPEWESAVSRRAGILYQQIAAMQRLVMEAGGSDDTLSEACAPYHRLLNELYENDLPLARAIDRSDLLLHLEGPAVEVASPRLSIVSGIMNDVQRATSSVVKLIVSATHEALTLPRELDFGLSSFARGSLYLGVELPSAPAGMIALPGDPWLTASRQSLEILGTAAARVESPQGLEQLRADFPDPRLRDAAIAGLERLAPSGRRGIDQVGLSGRCLPDRTWHRLTAGTRQTLREWLRQSVVARDRREVTGWVRQIDLDSRRLDLRQVTGLGGELANLRCLYPASLDRPARTWLGAQLKVSGRVEMYHGEPRLMEIEASQVMQAARTGTAETEA